MMEWRVFIHQAATFTPEQMLRELSLDSSAMNFAINLRGQPDLSGLTGLVAAAETGNSMLLVPPSNGRGAPIECWFAGVAADGTPNAASFGIDEQDAAGLADITADLCGIARGFLGVYLDSRRGAGWRGER
jgi:hypothetical protein